LSTNWIIIAETTEEKAAVEQILLDVVGTTDTIDKLKFPVVDTVKVQSFAIASKMLTADTEGLPKQIYPFQVVRTIL
jgi:hypothetical protein